MRRAFLLVLCAWGISLGGCAWLADIFVDNMIDNFGTEDPNGSFPD